MSSAHSGVFMNVNAGRTGCSLEASVILERSVRRPEGNFIPQSKDRFEHLVQDMSEEVKWHCSSFSHVARMCTFLLSS